MKTKKMFMLISFLIVTSLFIIPAGVNASTSGSGDTFTIFDDFENTVQNKIYTIEEKAESFGANESVMQMASDNYNNYGQVIHIKETVTVVSFSFKVDDFGGDNYLPINIYVNIAVFEEDVGIGADLSSTYFNNITEYGIYDVEVSITLEPDYYLFYIPTGAHNIWFHASSSSSDYQYDELDFVDMGHIDGTLFAWDDYIYFFDYLIIPGGEIKQETSQEKAYKGLKSYLGNGTETIIETPSMRLLPTRVTFYYLIETNVTVKLFYAYYTESSNYTSLEEIEIETLITQETRFNIINHNINRMKINLTETYDSSQKFFIVLKTSTEESFKIFIDELAVTYTNPETLFNKKSMTKGANITNWIDVSGSQDLLIQGRVDQLASPYPADYNQKYTYETETNEVFTRRMSFTVDFDIYFVPKNYMNNSHVYKQLVEIKAEEDFYLNVTVVFEVVQSLYYKDITIKIVNDFQDNASETHTFETFTIEDKNDTLFYEGWYYPQIKVDMMQENYNLLSSVVEVTERNTGLRYSSFSSRYMNEDEVKSNIITTQTSISIEAFIERAAGITALNYNFQERVKISARIKHSPVITQPLPEFPPYPDMSDLEWYEQFVAFFGWVGAIIVFALKMIWRIIQILFDFQSLVIIIESIVTFFEELLDINLDFLSALLTIPASLIAAFGAGFMLIPNLLAGLLDGSISNFTDFVNYLGGTFNVLMEVLVGMLEAVFELLGAVIIDFIPWLLELIFGVGVAGFFATIIALVIALFTLDFSTAFEIIFDFAVIMVDFSLSNLFIPFFSNIFGIDFSQFYAFFNWVISIVTGISATSSQLGSLALLGYLFWMFTNIQKGNYNVIWDSLKFVFNVFAKVLEYSIKGVEALMRILNGIITWITGPLT